MKFSGKKWVWRLALPVLLASAPVFCAEGRPEIVTNVDPNDLFMGESAILLVRVNNVKTPVAPNLSDFDADFAVKSMGDRTQDESSMTFVNGQLYQHTVYSHIYQYQLTPKHAGELKVPAPFVLVDGQKLAGAVSKMQVRAQEKQAAVLIDIIPSKTHVYPTQPFDVTLRIMVQPMKEEDGRDPLSLIAPPDLTIDWLKIPDGLSAPEFSEWLSPLRVNTGHGFTLNNLAVGDGDIFSGRQNAIFGLFTHREKRTSDDGKEIDYFVFELKRTFTPQKTGAFTFGPATLKGNFVAGQSGNHYTVKRLVLSSAPATVEVRDVPAPAPASYCGALGNYGVTSSAGPTTLRVGDPLTLKIDFIRGAGSGGIDLISAPDISANPQLAADFEIMDKAPTGQSSGEKKTFAYGLRPKRAGVKIPALSVATFNVDSEKFTDVSTPPIPLNVTQSTQVDAGDLVAAPTGPKAVTIRNQQGGVFQNFQDLGALQDQRSDPTWYCIGAFVCWLLSGLGCFFVLQQRKRSNDAAWQRRQRAMPEAERGLTVARAAMKSNEALSAARAIRESLTGLIGNILDLPAAGMTAHEAGLALTKAGASEALRKRTVDLLESIEALEYAPTSGQTVSAQLDEAATLVRELQRELNK